MITSLLFAAQLAAADPTFAEAKWQADTYETALSPRDSQALVEAQGKALKDALTVCGPARDTMPAFTIVAHVDASGVTDRTWLSSESAYALCIQQQLAKARLPVATGKAFHASYELSYAP